MTGPARQPLVTVVPTREAKTVLEVLEADVARPSPARNAKGRPELALVLACDLDRVVGAR